MRLIPCTLLALLGGLCSFTSSVEAVEILFNESFDAIDVAKLPPNLKIEKEVTIATEGTDKILRVKAAKGTNAGLVITLDPAKVKGKTYRVRVQAKFSGNYEVQADKTWARPRVALVITDSAKKQQWPAQVIKPAVTEWQPIEVVGRMPVDTESALLYLQVPQVEAEVYFNNLTFELEPEGVKVEASPADEKALIASKAPDSKLDNGGVLFNPAVALALQKSLPKTPATPNKILVAGALSNKETEGRLPAKWSYIAEPKGTGSGNPLTVLAALPELLETHKPELVILVADLEPKKKPEANNYYDWRDAAKLCIRMGAIPVIVMPPAGPEKDEALADIRRQLINASEDMKIAAIESKSANQATKRISEIADLFDRYVFCRVAPDAASTRKPTKVEDE